MTIRKRSLESFFLNLIAFLLVYEWFLPLREFEYLFLNFSIFVIILAVSFLLSFFEWKWYINLPIFIYVVILSVNKVFFPESLFWPDELMKDIRLNIDYMLDRSWFEITNAFRTLLMFIFIGLIVYLIHYWMIIRKKFFFFFLLTIIYLSVIDTFAPYFAGIAIIRTFVFGLLALGILSFYRIVEKNQLGRLSVFKNNWIVTLVVVVLTTTFIGVLVPKADPIWPDPLPTIQSYAPHHTGGGNGVGTAIKTIGYDEDDSRLGGPFLNDDTPVFRVISEHKQYWRVETKDFYTGKGWEKSQDDHLIEFTNLDEVLPLHSVEEDFLQEPTHVVVDTLGGKNHSIYPQVARHIYPDATGGIDASEGRFDASIFMSLPEEGARPFHFNQAIEKVEMPRDVETYTVTYQRPEYEINTLRQVKDASGIDENFLTRYTQIPENLPERVSDLARSITEEHDNWYDKARAVELYFIRNNYRYNTKNVPYPEEDQDYVDQFLFETLMGYCDNFSSSMAVLLRTVGIPTRWVKGYTPGDEVDRYGRIVEYEVKNTHAHSWVEVYFPEIGWVPFEPTRGFSNPSRFYMDITNNQTPEQNNDVETPELEEQQEEEEENDDAVAWSFSDIDWKALWDSVKGWVIGIGITLMIMAILLFISRNKWLPYWQIAKYRNKDDLSSFPNAYLALIKELERYGLVRNEGDTLRQYARKVDQYYRTDEMSQLTYYYEQLLYRNSEDQGSWEELKQTWINLIRKTRGKD